MQYTMTNLSRLITDVQNLINPIINITNSLVGNNSLFQLINCAFIGGDLSNSINAFSGGFSVAAQNLGTMIIIVSFIILLIIIFTLFMINFTIEVVDPLINNNPDNQMELQEIPKN